MRHCSGFSLTEVLIALLIINTGMLGALAGYTQVLKWTFDATQRTLAVAAAADLTSVLHHFPAAAISAQRLEPQPDTNMHVCNAGSICSSFAFLTYWQTLWQQQWHRHIGLRQPLFCLSTESLSYVVLQASWQPTSAVVDVSAEAVDCQPVAGRSGFRIRLAVLVLSDD